MTVNSDDCGSKVNFNYKYISHLAGLIILCDEGSVEYAECGVLKMRSVECRKCGVGVENAECRKCGVCQMRSVLTMRSLENFPFSENPECQSIFHSPVRPF